MFFLLSFRYKKNVFLWQKRMVPNFIDVFFCCTFRCATSSSRSTLENRQKPSRRSATVSPTWSVLAPDLESGTMTNNFSKCHGLPPDAKPEQPIMDSKHRHFFHNQWNNKLFNTKKWQYYLVNVVNELFFLSDNIVKRRKKTVK